jgi:hypothetical protein
MRHGAIKMWRVDGAWGFVIDDAGVVLSLAVFV